MEIEKANEDERGEIWKVETGKQVLFLAKTYKDYARGGDLHKGKQFTLILEGSMEVRIKYQDREEIQILKENEMIIVPPEIPHVFIALEDSVFLEWHEFPLPSYKEKRFYPPYRRLCKCS